MCVPDIVEILNFKVFNLMSGLIKQDTENEMKHVSVNVDQMREFVIINNVGVMINEGVNVKK